MTHFPHDDEPLIQFLKQHRPIPPITASSVEKQLMQWVAKEPNLASDQRISLLWLILSAIATVGLVTWLGWRGSHSSFGIAAQSEELESFVIESWNGSLEELSYAPKETKLENAWFILEESDTKLEKQN
jgi:hypothetical protein